MERGLRSIPSNDDPLRFSSLRLLDTSEMGTSTVPTDRHATRSVSLFPTPSFIFTFIRLQATSSTAEWSLLR
jgi:hypothetical protein